MRPLATGMVLTLGLLATTAAADPVPPAKPAPKAAATSSVSASAKPAAAAAKPASATASATTPATAPKPKPKPKPVVNSGPPAIPVECLNVVSATFGAPEGVDIAGPDHATAHFDAEIASTSPQRGQGLMCRQTLAQGKAMLFEFPAAGEQTFWMRDTVLSLDILFIAPDGHIVSIIKRAHPLSDRKLPSHGDANGVLEIRGGQADALGLKPGDVVSHPFFASH